MKFAEKIPVTQFAQLYYPATAIVAIYVSPIGTCTHTLTSIRKVCAIKARKWLFCISQLPLSFHNMFSSFSYYVSVALYGKASAITCFIAAFSREGGCMENELRKPRTHCSQSLHAHINSYNGCTATGCDKHYLRVHLSTYVHLIAHVCMCVLHEMRAVFI